MLIMVIIMEEYIKNIDLQTVSMQTLAFIGDSIYDLYIRTYLASKGNEKAGKLHKKAVSYVSAKSQSKIMDKINSFLPLFLISLSILFFTFLLKLFIFLLIFNFFINLLY